MHLEQFLFNQFLIRRRWLSTLPSSLFYSRETMASYIFYSVHLILSSPIFAELSPFLYRLGFQELILGWTLNLITHQLFSEKKNSHPPCIFFFVENILVYCNAFYENVTY